jgi:hypothetical protein
MTSRITLGPLTLVAFEIPEFIAFGGRQRMAVHDLPGGGRMIDLLGPAESDLVFSGIFSGVDAGDRARALDALRLAGNTQPLSWDGNSFAAIIAEASFTYAKPWWIPYRLRCVIRSGASGAALSPAAGVASDLATAAFLIGGLAPLGTAQTAITGSTALAYGSAGYIAAAGALSTADTAVTAGIGSTGAMLAAVDLSAAGPDVSATAGNLAALAWGAGYLGRSLFSLATLGG